MSTYFEQRRNNVPKYSRPPLSVRITFKIWFSAGNGALDLWLLMGDRNLRPKERLDYREYHRSGRKEVLPNKDVEMATDAASDSDVKVLGHLRDGAKFIGYPGRVLGKYCFEKKSWPPFFIMKKSLGPSYFYVKKVLAPRFFQGKNVREKSCCPTPFFERKRNFHRFFQKKVIGTTLSKLFFFESKKVTCNLSDTDTNFR